MSFYLKYRPQKIKDLDLQFVRESLGEILVSKKIPHAFLFVGPKGTGKTSGARILAKSVNCLNPPANGGEPCNKCQVCTSVNQGNALDLIEIDGASNRGIDDIRELKSKINLAPGVFKIKIYIIDEVHMLTTEAFNALLKTLEEPPEQVKFVLCTTEPQKIPETIVSRCTKIEFHKAGIEEVVRALNRVVKGEKIKIDDEDLERIAKKAGGSFRDAVKILEQLAIKSKKISSKRVLSLLERGIGEEKIDDWLRMIYNQKVNQALNWLGQAVGRGVDLKQLTVDSIEKLRDCLMIKLGVGKGEDILKDQDFNQVKELTELFHQKSMEINRAVIETLPLEMLIIEWGNIGNIEEIEPADTEDIEMGLKAVESKWPEVIKRIKPYNHSLEALLKAAKPTGFDNQFLVLEVFYQFHKERLENERYKQLVEQVVSEVFGDKIRIRYTLAMKPKKQSRVNQEHQNISTDVDEDIIKTAEEVFLKGGE